jgi:hypothetical protein
MITLIFAFGFEQNQGCLYVVVSLENLSILKITSPVAQLSRKFLENFKKSSALSKIVLARP